MCHRVDHWPERKEKDAINQFSQTFSFSNEKSKSWASLRYRILLPDVKTRAIDRHWCITLRFSKYVASRWMETFDRRWWMSRLKDRQTGRMVKMHNKLMQISVLRAMQKPLWKYIWDNGVEFRILISQSFMINITTRNFKSNFWPRGNDDLPQ